MVLPIGVSWLMVEQMAAVSSSILTEAFILDNLEKDRLTERALLELKMETSTLGTGSTIKGMGSAANYFKMVQPMKETSIIHRNLAVVDMSLQVETFIRVFGEKIEWMVRGYTNMWMVLHL